MTITLKWLDWVSWVFALLLILAGIMNMIYVHMGLGLIYLFISLLYTPTVYQNYLPKVHPALHWSFKLILAVVLVMFTLGVSDLGDMIDKL